MAKTDPRSPKRKADARAVVWILGSFALLVAGLVAGAIAGEGLRWILPVAGFVGYVLVMSHGLRRWSPDDLDRVWRSPSSVRAPRAIGWTRPRLFPCRGELGGRRPMRPQGPSTQQQARPATGPERA